MNGLKRSYGSVKSANTNRYPIKGKNVSKTRLLKLTEVDPYFHLQFLGFPIIKQCDVSRMLPRYCTVLSRTVEDGVGMEDLDQLQQDLEKLLSNCAVRNRMLLSENENVERAEEHRKNKSGKSYKKKKCLKRRWLDERTLVTIKDLKGNSKLMKTIHNFPINNIVTDLQLKREVPKVNFPKNDTSDKFWLSIEPFCADVSKNDLAFIDELLEECVPNIRLKILQRGDHYTIKWSPNSAQNDTNGTRTNGPKAITFGNEVGKNGIVSDKFATPTTQGLAVALVNEKLKSSNLYLSKASNGSKNGVCMDVRMKRELIEQGMLDDDLTKGEEMEDELLIEMKKSVRELRMINENNAAHLNRLKQQVERDLQRQEIKYTLDKVDNEIMDVYNKIAVAKRKHSNLIESEAFEKAIVPKLNLSRYQEEADDLIQEQVLLHRELIELSDLSLLIR